MTVRDLHGCHIGDYNYMSDVAGWHLIVFTPRGLCQLCVIVVGHDVLRLSMSDRRVSSSMP